MTTTNIGEDKLAELKRKRNELMTQATQAAYEYFCECETGNERIKAHDIYDNLLNAGRVYG